MPHAPPEQKQKQLKSVRKNTAVNLNIDDLPCANNIQAIGLRRHEQLVNLLRPNKKLNFNVNLSNLL